MRTMWPVAVVVALFAALGVGNLLKARPGRSDTAVQTQAKLDAVPMTVGRWAGRPVDVPEKSLKAAEAQAYLSRSYARDDGAEVAVLLLYGEPGALGAHTPEVCYEGAGFRRASKPEKLAVPGEPAEFWTARFESAGFPPATLQVTWGHGADGVWKASDTPRLDFADRSAIFKLYVSRALPPAAGPTAGGAAKAPDPTEEFLQSFLKPLTDTLTRPAAPAAGGPTG